MPHPTVIIFLWLCLTAATQSLHGWGLFFLGLLLAVMVWKLSVSRFAILLRRTRWIIFSLLLIYGYATPGTAVWVQAGLFSPTQQGVSDGLLQLWRLVCVLAGLSIVLSLLSRQQLISGLYVLAYPLNYLGLSRERFAVRLALTLHYAESAMLKTATDWHDSIENMLAPADSGQHHIQLAVEPFTLRDGALLLAGCASIALVLL